MLWVWLVSQSFCVAHCHGMFQEASGLQGDIAALGGTTSSLDFKASSGESRAGIGDRRGRHSCCSKGHLAERPKCDPTPGSNNAADESPALPSADHCTTKAVIQASDPLGDLASTAADILDRELSGADAAAAWLADLRTQPAARLSNHLRWNDPRVPRRDTGYDPSVTLGRGLRSLAPPRAD